MSSGILAGISSSIVLYNIKPLFKGSQAQQWSNIVKLAVKCTERRSDDSQMTVERS